MSTLVPTRYSSVSVPCPGCDAPMEVDIEIIGRHIRATRWTPAETPEVYVLTVLTGCAVCGTVFDRWDRDELRAAAEREAHREFC